MSPGLYSIRSEPSQSKFGLDIAIHPLARSRVAVSDDLKSNLLPIFIEVSWGELPFTFEFLILGCQFYGVLLVELF